MLRRLTRRARRQQTQLVGECQRVLLSLGIVHRKIDIRLIREFISSDDDVPFGGSGACAVMVKALDMLSSQFLSPLGR
jgi:hypothetical protein